MKAEKRKKREKKVEGQERDKGRTEKEDKDRNRSSTEIYTTEKWRKLIAIKTYKLTRKHKSESQ